jgi:ribonuclease-3
MPHQAIQARLGYTFRNPALLVEALTHSSYAPEHADAGPHNQRLEFLGDAVLLLVLTEALFREFPDEREGVLSRRRAGLTKGLFLSQLARDLGIAEGLRLGRSELDAGGHDRASTLEDAMEALVGAIFLDSDFDTARRVILGWYGSISARVALTEDHENPKGRLQELVQPEHGNNALRYDVTGIDGPNHAREFAVTVFFLDKPIGSGRGSSKKAAEEQAARVALETLRAGR